MKAYKLVKKNGKIVEQSVYKTNDAEFASTINDFGARDVEYDSFVFEDFEAAIGETICLKAFTCQYEESGDVYFIRMQLWGDNAKVKMCSIGE